MQVEYLLIGHTTEQALNAYGAEGWDFAGITPQASVILKRMKFPPVNMGAEPARALEIRTEYDIPLDKVARETALLVDIWQMGAQSLPPEMFTSLETALVQLAKTRHLPWGTGGA